MRGAWRGAAAIGVLAMAQLAGAPAAALQILQAADHAELSAEVSSKEVNRIAVEGDRIARVVQSGGGFTLEHDPVRGDLYLYPAEGGAGTEGTPAPVTLYVGSEKGLTFRLTLIAVERESAQILIRPAAAGGPGTAPRAVSGDARASAIIALIGAVARREPLPGYTVVPASNVADGPEIGGKNARIVDEATAGARLIETWRGPRFTVRVLEVLDGEIRDASALAAARGAGVIAAWLSDPADGGPADGGPARRHDAGGDPAAHTATAANPRLGVVVEPNAFHEAGP